MISDVDQAAYTADGHVLVPQALDPQFLCQFEPDLTHVVRNLSPASFHRQFLEDYGCSIAQLLPARSGQPSQTYARAFTQRPNLWRYSTVVAELVRSRALAQLAADLMGVAGVRLYHDQALYKEAGGGHTPWHVDQFYWPLASEKTITAWIPLQDVSLPMGPVVFASGSQQGPIREVAGQLAISDESEARLAQLVADAPQSESTYRLGDVSFHSGWTCHRAGPNVTDQTRAAFTIIYMDADTKMLLPEHDSQRTDAALWLPGIQPGELAASHLNPLLYHQDADGEADA